MFVRYSMRRATVWLATLMLSTVAQQMQAQGGALPQDQTTPQPERKQLTQGTQPPVPGKDLTGNWQGTLQLEGGRGLRTIVKITENDGKYKAVLYSIDQGGQPIGVTSIALAGATLNFAIAPLDLTYTGKLNPDGNSIAGSATQHGQTHALNLDHVTAENAWAIPEPPKAMPADADPVYEVATIKPSDPNAGGRNWGQRGRQVYMHNATVAGLLQITYGLHAKQIVGAPEWISTDKFDIDGVPDVAGLANQEQIKVMFGILLASRFQFKYHVEKRELPVYTIAVAKGGPRMTVSAGGREGFAFSKPGALIVRNETMADFAKGMQRAVMDKPVVDQSGLTDHFDFNLNWTPDESQFIPLGVKISTPAMDDPKAPPSLSTALEEQLGLKLENTRASVDVFVVDQLEKPSEN